MSFRDPAQSLGDIHGIDRIERCIVGMQFDDFRGDFKSIDAVERNLLRISEAATRLGGEAEVLCPGLPWRDIRGIGNWLRHQYDHVDLNTVWRTVVDDLPRVKASVQAALRRMEAQ